MVKRNINKCIKYALSEEEIEENIRKGLLSKNIRQLVTKKDQKSQYYICNELTDAYFKSQGVLESFISSDFLQRLSFTSDSFYITDLFLIRCAGRVSKSIVKKTKLKLFMNLQIV